MKYADKWVVVPYNSINKKIFPKSKVVDQIFKNKTLTKDEKLASYNNHIIRKLRKKLLEKNDIQEKNESENQDDWIDEDEEEDYDEEEDEQNEEEIKEEKNQHSDEEELKNEDLSGSIFEPPFNNYLAKRKNQRRISSRLSQTSKPIRFKIESDEEMDYIKNKSMYHVPAYKNTRSKRKISDASFAKISENSKVQLKRRKKLNDSISKKIISNTGIIKNWTLLNKNNDSK